MEIIGKGFRVETNGNKRFIHSSKDPAFCSEQSWMDLFDRPQFLYEEKDSGWKMCLKPI